MRLGFLLKNMVGIYAVFTKMLFRITKRGEMLAKMSILWYNAIKKRFASHFSFYERKNPIMKKLLLIAILMLALVFTVVACTETPAGTDTTASDTTAETPTEEATTEAPTEETPTEEVTTEAPTEEVTTDAPVEETTTEASTEAPETEAPKGGCGSVIGFSALAVLALGGALCIKRKEN